MFEFDGSSYFFSLSDCLNLKYFGVTIVELIYFDGWKFLSINSLPASFELVLLLVVWGSILIGDWESLTWFEWVGLTILILEVSAIFSSWALYLFIGPRLTPLIKPVWLGSYFCYFKLIFWVCDRSAYCLLPPELLPVTCFEFDDRSLLLFPWSILGYCKLLPPIVSLPTEFGDFFVFSWAFLTMAAVNAYWSLWPPFVWLLKETWAFAASLFDFLDLFDFVEIG